jgi:hypothetical protein
MIIFHIIIIIFCNHTFLTDNFISMTFFGFFYFLKVCILQKTMCCVSAGKHFVMENGHIITFIKVSAQILYFQTKNQTLSTLNTS